MWRRRVCGLVLGVGALGCATAASDATSTPGEACSRVTVEADTRLRTRRGLRGSRDATALWIDPTGVPRVTWTRTWWSASTRGRAHRELVHARPSGRRFVVTAEPAPPTWSRVPDEARFDGARWYAVRRGPGPEQELWSGPPWRAVVDLRGQSLFPLRLGRDGSLLLVTLDAERGTSAPFRARRLVAGEVVEDREQATREAIEDAWSRHGEPRSPRVVDGRVELLAADGWTPLPLQWPTSIPRDPEFDSLDVASRDGRAFVVGLAWRPRGPAIEHEHAHRDGAPSTTYRDERVGAGTLVVWPIRDHGAPPIVARGLRLHEHQRPSVALGPRGELHVLLHDAYASGFANDRYVRLRCEPARAPDEQHDP